MKIIALHILLLLGFAAKAQSPFHSVRINLQSENFEVAKEVLDSCSFKNYCQDSVLYYRGFMILKKGNIKSARTICNILEKSYPGFKEVHYLSALIYFVDENFGSSIEEFGKVLKSNPGHMKALYNRALAYGLLEDHQNAIKDLTECITLDGKYGLAYYSRAYWYEFTGNMAEAKKDYEKSMELDPKNYDAYLGLAYIYQNQKDSTKACEVINKAVSAGSLIAEELKENFCKDPGN